jgi:hypothetical protein
MHLCSVVSVLVTFFSVTRVVSVVTEYHIRCVGQSQFCRYMMSCLYAKCNVLSYISASIFQLRYDRHDVPPVQPDVMDDVARDLLTLFTNHLVRNKYLDISGWDTFCKM